MLQGVSMDQARGYMVETLEAFPTTLEISDIMNQSPHYQSPMMSEDTTMHLPRFGDVFGTSPPQTVPTEDPLSDCGMSDTSEEGCKKEYFNLTPTTLHDDSVPAINIKTDAFATFETQNDAMDSWVYKHPEEWGSKEILDWIYSWLPKLSFNSSESECCGENFSNLDGKALIKMSEEEFMKLEPTYGKMYYAMLHKLLQESMFVVDPIDHEPSQEDSWKNFINEEAKAYMRNPATFTYDFEPNAFEDMKTDPTDDDGYESTSSGEYTQVPTTVMTCADDKHQLEATNLLHLPGNRWNGMPGGGNHRAAMAGPAAARQRARGDSGSSMEGGALVAPPTQKKRGRRLGQVSNKGNHLWEFIRDLLKSPNTNPTLIRWEDEENGVFRIVNSKKVSELWGKKKNNPGMNYEKLSRAMRHYYKSKILVAVLGRRLVYRFGVNSTGWQKPTTNSAPR